MCIGVLVKYTLFLLDVNKTQKISTDFRKILKYQVSLKSVYWESSFFHANSRMIKRHDESNSNFWKFCERA